MSAPPRFRDLENALAALPPNVIGEILFGRLVTQPRPAWRHARATTHLSHQLGPPFDRGIGGPGGWTFAFEPELAMGPHVLVPDYAGWRSDALPDGLDVARVSIAPDWVCEVLSPSTATIDREEKALVYAANGVEHLWLLDPIAKTVEVKRSELGRWHDVATYAGDAALRIEPFGAIELVLGEIWSR